MPTVKETMHKIAAHEKECTIRYENIERRLEEGSQKFKRLELMLWGIYPLLIGLFVAGKFG